MSVGIAVIGTGDFGEQHVQTLSQMSGVHLHAVCDLDLKRAEAVAKQWDVPKFTNNMEEIFRDERIQGVIIATSESSHYSVSMAAMKASKHVLLEKPVSLDLGEISDMYETAEKNKLIFLPGHMLRYDASYHTIKKRLDSGELGQIYSIYARRNVPVERFALHSRTHPVFMALVHDIDIILWYVQSRVKRVFAMEKKTSPEYKHPNIFWGLVEFENNVVAALETQWLLPNHLGRYLDVKLDMMTSKGKVALQYPGDNLSFAIDDSIETPDVTLWPEIFGKSTGALHNELEYFISEIKSNGAVKQPIREDEVKQGIRLGQLLIESAQTGQSIIVD